MHAPWCYVEYLAMGRKRNQGKARKAAKAKAEERGDDNDNQRRNERQQSLAVQMQHMQIGAAPISSDTTKCWHGCQHMDKTCIDFVVAFREVFYDKDGGGADILDCLFAAEDATLDKFAEVWNDSAKMESAISMLLCNGTQHVLDGNYASARDFATFARFLSNTSQLCCIKLKL